MRLDDRQQQLLDERSREERYVKEVEERRNRPVAYETTQNAKWLTTGAPRVSHSGIVEFVGRVALHVRNDAVLDGATEFYIGHAYGSVDGVPVYNWMAPVACTFFRGSFHHSLCPDVGLIRTFTHRNGTIADFADEAVGADSATFRRQSLSIPLPPRGALQGHSSLSEAPPMRPPSSPSNAAPAVPPQQSSSGFRAKKLLLGELNAPRTGTMTSVLATLQPEQYDLIRRPGRANLIVNGHPGSGKTVIAAYRTAFLASDVDGEPVTDRVEGRVLLVGPTVGYAAHVRHLVEGLTTSHDRLAIYTVQRLLMELAGFQTVPTGPEPMGGLHTSAELALYVDRAIRTMSRAEKRWQQPSSIAHIYDHLRGWRNGSAAPGDLPPRWRQYFASLPPFRDAVTQRLYLPLLAYIGSQLRSPTSLANVGHVVVDEAQDVTQLEWVMLRRLNRGFWTLLGDLNQRRSEANRADWDTIARCVGIVPAGGKAPVTILDRAYRSTAEIVGFANQLLYPHERSARALRHGAAVRTTLVQQADLGPQAVHLAEQFLAAHPSRSVAIIGHNLRAVHGALRSRGWIGSQSLQEWTRPQRKVRTLTADQARGLEFDAVIVIEPSDFPEEQGRRGALYTALTRANLELAVLHSQPLPQSLTRPTT